MVLLPHPLHVDLLAVELRAVQVGDAAHHLRAGRHGDQPVALGPGAAGVGDHLSTEHLWGINRFETDPVSPSLRGGLRWWPYTWRVKPFETLLVKGYGHSIVKAEGFGLQRPQVNGGHFLCTYFVKLHPAHVWTSRSMNLLSGESTVEWRLSAL